MTPTDRQQLSSIGAKARTAMAAERLDVLADRGYFSGEEIRTCEAMGITPYGRAHRGRPPYPERFRILTHQLMGLQTDSGKPARPPYSQSPGKFSKLSARFSKF
jgi:hypothetical protein